MKKAAIPVLLMFSLLLSGAGCKYEGQSTSASSSSTSVSADSFRPEISLQIRLDQPYTNSILQASKINAPQNSWLVIYQIVNNKLGPVVGYGAVNKGDNKKAVLQIDSSKVTPEMIAALHYDHGKIGVFEYPGSDSPITVDGKPLMVRFALANDVNITTQVSGVDAKILNNSYTSSTPTP